MRRWGVPRDEQHSADSTWCISWTGEHRWLVYVAGAPLACFFRRSDARQFIGSFKDYM